MGASGVKNEIRNYAKREINNEAKIGTKINQNGWTKSEIFTGHKPVPVKIINKVMKSICQITIETKKGKSYGTGFFLNYSNSLKYLITDHHATNPDPQKRKHNNRNTL